MPRELDLIFYWLYIEDLDWEIVSVKIARAVTFFTDKYVPSDCLVESPIYLDDVYVNKLI